MYKEQPSNDGGLAVMYTFKSGDISKATNGKVHLLVAPCLMTSRKGLLHLTPHSAMWRMCCGRAGLHCAQ